MIMTKTQRKADAKLARKAIAKRARAERKQKLNTQASHHIGVIDCDGSQTPVGINIYGLTFEDANYKLADEWSHDRYASWQRNIIRAMQQGEFSGNVEGLDWRFQPEADSDTGILYPIPGEPAQVTPRFRNWPCAESSPFEDDAIYEDLSGVAVKLRESLQGDSGYTTATSNYIALVERISGYIYAQYWCKDYESYLAETTPKDDIFLFVHDLACQLAQDAIMIPGFAPE